MPTIGVPLQGYYYDVNTDTLRPLAGTGVQGLPGASQFGLTFTGDATANVTLTSMAAAEDYFNTSVRYATKMDLTGYTQCRLVMRKMATAGPVGAAVMLKFSTTNPASAFSGAAWTASGAQCTLTGTNTTVDSGWINMPAGMCVNDIFICPTQGSGDGAASPVVGGLWVYFRNPGIVIPQADFRGIIGYVETTTAQTGIGPSLVDMTGLSITFTAVTGRRYKISWYGNITQVAAGVAQVLLTDSANTQISATAQYITAGGYAPFGGFAVKTFTAGSTILKLRASSGGGTTMNTAVATGQPFSLLVEDIG